MTASPLRQRDPAQHCHPPSTKAGRTGCNQAPLLGTSHQAAASRGSESRAVRGRGHPQAAANGTGQAQWRPVRGCAGARYPARRSAGPEVVEPRRRNQDPANQEGHPAQDLAARLCEPARLRGQDQAVQAGLQEAPASMPAAVPARLHQPCPLVPQRHGGGLVEADVKSQAGRRGIALPMNCSP